MIEWVIEPFARRHERDGFSCGVPALDAFIRTHVSQYEKRRLGKAYVAVAKGMKRVLGYYTLAAGAVPFENLPSSASAKLPKHSVPVVLLARLAVDRSTQGMHLGERLLLDSLNRSLDLPASIGVHAVIVDSVDAHAAGFYRKFGFLTLLDDLLHLYLPLNAVEELLGM